MLTGQRPTDREEEGWEYNLSLVLMWRVLAVLLRHLLQRLPGRPTQVFWSHHGLRVEGRAQF